MKIKKRKLLEIVCFAIIGIVIVGFMVNWYMRNRLEGFLREKLSERISEATGGFYQFHSQHLDIGLFNGELTLKGVELKLDSTVFKEWASKDSLPQNYFDIEIERIHFKGLNLVWLFNYRQLHFDLFEIQRPVVKVFESEYSSRLEIKNKNQSSKSLHELISPYMDALTVKKMNLENASISYLADDQGTPVVYGLKDVSFHAYGFVLDQNSAQSGKLLFCDNFDFTTNQPQVLLSNNQFLLQTDNIRLSTKDSIIQIDKARLEPRTLLWEQQNALPDTYLDAKVNSIEVKGVRFKRKNAYNYLEANSFNINKSEIEYFNVRRDSVKIDPKKEPETKDTLNLSWTLYAIVSPILHSITIDKIGIEDARFKYINSSKDAVDIYNLDRFNFEAYGFKVDSLADIQQRFLYSQGFSVDAADIKGVVNSQNHAMSIERMKLNTLTKDFQINNVKLSPLKLKTQKDYIVGTIDSIRLSGWEYDKGMRAQRLSIDAPRIEYVKMHKSKKKEITEVNDKSVNLNAVTPLFNHISIGEVNLNNGNITFRDKTNKDNLVYKLPKIDFFASNFLINEITLKHSHTYFACDNLRFSFERFDNLLPGKDYRLMIRKGVYTGIQGNLELYDLKLLPQKDTWKKAPDTYFSVLIPFVAVRHIDYKISEKENTFMFNSFNIESPTIQIVKTGAASNTSKKGSEQKDKTISFIAGLFDISNAKVEYSDRTTKDSLNTTVGKLQLKALSWDADMKNTSIGEITLQSPVVNYKKEMEGAGSQSKASTSKAFTGSIKIGRIGVSDIRVGVDQPGLKLHFETSNLDILDIKLNNQIFNLSSVDVAKPLVKINQISKSEQKSKVASDKQDIYNIFGQLGKQVSVNKFNVSDANIDYASTLNGKLYRQQQLNTTSLFFSGLVVNSELKTFALDDINFSTRNFHFPINNGFYTLQAEAIDLKKKEGSLNIEKLHLVPAYPKKEFAYHHPTHKDWFDVGVGHISLSGIDFNRYFANNIFHARELLVKDVELLNFKNQQIEIQHNIMPMIYEGLQKLPVKFDIDTANVNNFKVVYEELPKNNTVSGVIFFTNMNGRLSGLTNIVSRPHQYIKLDADGNLQGTGYFTATWMLPVDSLNDHFHLKAHLHQFDLRDLNQLITPMAPARVESGYVKSVIFNTDASSKGATIEMLMLYNDLSVSVLRNKDGELTTNSFASTVANKVIKTNNPDKPHKRARHVHVTIERNAYHSTFNYLWQILQPAVVESVGFSQKKQNFAKKVSGFIHKMKNIFHKDKKEDKKGTKGTIKPVVH
ncbi:uncharacterized protein DUF748 [Dysgonomonas alginatilytica]|uniref:Uncharacterized protein DUF748 n=1 Tax=Dysgonomonas alginatilytica TaxID=1605892 RepID=A0A2V3PLL4_9BACT|nr:DUF748 domain-containing protein [Dysgonomonas alginatilytica]PXV62651.1 uncharacterized protein DUF748 [Dysgonomonas alginatilytica]